MGYGYFILVWDSFGSGLVRINPRLHTEGLDVYDNPKNWWPCTKHTPMEDITVRHNLIDSYENFKIYFN